MLRASRFGGGESLVDEDQSEHGDVRTEQQARLIRYTRNPEFVLDMIVSHIHNSRYGLDGNTDASFSPR